MNSLAMLPARKFKGAAFTLLEIVTVVAIIVILLSMIIGVVSGIRARADRAACMSNLKSLYAAGATYVQQQGHWPQIPTTLLRDNKPEFARQWYVALEPCGISRINWVCPTVQRLLKDPDLYKRENARIDYLSTPFDERPMTPYLWPLQPWFVEVAASHDGGNLVIFSNGTVNSMRDVMRMR